MLVKDWALKGHYVFGYITSVTEGPRHMPIIFYFFIMTLSSKGKLKNTLIVELNLLLYEYIRQLECCLFLFF